MDCFLSSEVQVTLGWLERAQYHGAVDPRVGCIAFLDENTTEKDVIPYTGNGSVEQIEVYMGEHLTHFHRQGTPSFLFGSLGVLVSKQVIERIGGFDERFSPGSFAEEDFALRSLAAGFLHTNAVDVFLYHMNRFAPENAAHSEANAADNWRSFMAKCYSTDTRSAAIGDFAALEIPDGMSPNIGDIYVPLSSPLASLAQQALAGVPRVCLGSTIPGHAAKGYAAGSRNSPPRTPAMLQNILLPLALIGIGATCTPSAPPADLGPGSVAPDFSITQWYNFEGGDTLASLQGKVVLLDFWRTW